VLIENLRSTLMAPNASTLVTFGIPSLAILVFAALSLLIAKTDPRGRRRAVYFALGSAIFLAVSGVFAQRGAFIRSDTFPPPLLAVMLPVLILPFALGFSQLGTAVSRSAPLAWLVGFHAFRLPLELVMHSAAREGVMPVQMTFTGYNFDILTGVSAVCVAALLALGRAPRWLVLAWNVLGSVLLCAIIVIAITSLPLIHAFGSAPSELNTWVAYFPFVWLPVGPVSAAIFGHILLWRRLAASARATSAIQAPPAACHL
jgi:hypothetical protein